MADIFISYSKGYQAQTEQLAKELRAKGFSVWYDTSLVPGDSFRDVIISELAQARAAIVIWNAASVKSEWVCSEASRARARRILIPVRTDDIRSHDIPPPFDSLHTELLSNGPAIDAALAKLGVTPTLGTKDEMSAQPPSIDEVAGPALALPDKPSIAVLPFQNMSGDPDQEYFADGMVEDITTALSRIRQFLVIARNSSFTYKGRTVDVKQAGRELGVRYILEGSVRRVADRVRVTAQLIDAITGHHLWAERYDRELVAVFAVQDEIADKVVAAIEPRLYSAEQTRVGRKPPGSLDAWECVVRALPHIDARSRHDFAIARELLERAVRLDPSYGHAYAFLAFLTCLEFGYGWTSRQIVLEHGLEAAQKAVVLDGDDAWAHFAVGFVYIYSRRAEEAVVQFERALALNPNFAPACSAYAVALTYLGRGQEALLKMDASERLNPRGLFRGVNAGMRAAVYFAMGQYRDAVACAQNAIRENPGLTNAYRSIIVSHALLGEIDEAQKALQTLKRLHPDLSLKWIKDFNPYPPGVAQKWIEGFVLAGLE
jgi:TolB-like protein/Tfp pilus assembly protein PilF